MLLSSLAFVRYFFHFCCTHNTFDAYFDLRAYTDDDNNNKNNTSNAFGFSQSANMNFLINFLLFAHMRAQTLDHMVRKTKSLGTLRYVFMVIAERLTSYLIIMLCLSFFFPLFIRYFYLLLFVFSCFLSFFFHLLLLHTIPLNLVFIFY